jgi:hypothetical protein
LNDSGIAKNVAIPEYQFCEFHVYPMKTHVLPGFYLPGAIDKDITFSERDPGVAKWIKLEEHIAPDPGCARHGIPLSQVIEDLRADLAAGTEYDDFHATTNLGGSQS